MLCLTPPALQGPDMQLPDAVAVPLSAGTAGIVLSFVLSPAELVKVTPWVHPKAVPAGCIQGLFLPGASFQAAAGWVSQFNPIH